MLAPSSLSEACFPLLFLRGLFERPPLHELDMIVADSILSTLSRVCMTCQTSLSVLGRAIVCSRHDGTSLGNQKPVQNGFSHSSSNRIICILLLDWLRLHMLSSMLFKLDDP